jgi:hypothetical protein
MDCHAVWKDADPDIPVLKEAKAEKKPKQSIRGCNAAVVW